MTGPLAPSQSRADLGFDMLNDLLLLHHCPFYCVLGIREKGLPWPLGWMKASIITQPLGREWGSLCPLLRGPVQSDDYKCSVAASFWSSEKLHFGFSEPLVGMWVNEAALQSPAPCTPVYFGCSTHEQFPTSLCHHELYCGETLHRQQHVSHLLVLRLPQ